MHESNIYQSQLIRKILASGAIGNILETYDLILISLMAQNLSQAFFQQLQNLILMLSIFYIFL